MTRRNKKELLNLSARLSMILRSRVNGHLFIFDMSEALKDTGADLYMDFASMERKLRDLMTSYVSEAEDFLKQRDNS